MNGRSLLAIICVLFVIGIFWMIMVIPQVDTSKTRIALFERTIPIPKEAAVSSEPTKPSEQKEPTLAEQAVPTPSEKEEPTEEKPKPETAEAASDEPPELVEYTPEYGRVSFTHMKHMDDYEIDCADCHHEDMEGGMSKCTNCHEPPKNALHKNCQGCHKDLEKEGKKTGPVKCRECHVKETG